MPQQTYFIKKALLSQGWAKNVRLGVDDKGLIVSLQANVLAEQDDHRLGLVIPGLVNCHSHAFQRAMAGLTEYQVSPTDTFWSWRKTMYRFANLVSPEDLQDIASYLYLEMIKQGYTSVAEFHYVHHQPNGKPYSSVSQLSQSVINAANIAGINLTLLPVLYMNAGFGDQALLDDQKRFGNSVDSYLALHDEATRYCSHQSQHSVGMALHSLRAVPASSMTEVISHFKDRAHSCPIHIHIAEQTQEVEQSIKALGKRPVEWLLDKYDIDKQWCLIHATHMTPKETAQVAKSGATVVICPTTEANLGDGLFPLRQYLDDGGQIAIGSDGNTCTNPMEELRWLEYGQRLLSRTRNVASDDRERHTGTNLYRHCLEGGARSIGQKPGALTLGGRADLIVLDDNSADLANIAADSILDVLIFGTSQSLIKDVMVNGTWKITHYHHADEERIKNTFISATKALRD
jgi:formimidoylglutamate deiminase